MIDVLHALCKGVIGVQPIFFIYFTLRNILIVPSGLNLSKQNHIALKANNTLNHLDNTAVCLLSTDNSDGLNDSGS